MKFEWSEIKDYGNIRILRILKKFKIFKRRLFSETKGFDYKKWKVVPWNLSETWKINFELKSRLCFATKFSSVEDILRG